MKRFNKISLLFMVIIILTVNSNIVYSAVERQKLNFSEELFIYDEFESTSFLGGVSDGVSADYRISEVDESFLKLTVWSYKDEKTAVEQFEAIFTGENEIWGKAEYDKGSNRIETGAENEMFLKERDRSYSTKIIKKIKTAYKNFMVEMSLSFKSTGYKNYLDYKLTPDEKSKLSEEYIKANKHMSVFEANVLNSLDNVDSFNENESFFTGTVTDGKSHPLKNAFIYIAVEKGNRQTVLEGTTDVNGRYKIKADIKPDEIKPNSKIKAEIILYLTYKQEEIEYFNLVYGMEKNSPAGSMDAFSPVKICREVELNSSKALKNDFILDNKLDRTLYTIEPEIDTPEDIGAVYFHMTEVLEFYKDHLNVNIAKDLPVEVMLYADETYYSPASTSIFIGADDMIYNSPNRPHNREWHEFSHHAMFCMYGSSPICEYTEKEIDQIARDFNMSKEDFELYFILNDDKMDSKFALFDFQQNHKGFLNSSTSDSLMEGFAEFMSLVMGKHYKYQRYDVYSQWGSLEVNYFPYDSLGTDEELAVAGILWDIIDSSSDYNRGTDDDDDVSLDFSVLWKVLSHYHRDFTSMYEELINVVAKDDASLKGNINKIFKLHRFFSESEQGNSQRDYWEAYIDEENTGRYDEGEAYLDFPENFTYTEGEKIGTPADANRKYRRNTAYRPGHFIKTGNTFPYFIINVDFIDFPHLSYSTKAKNTDGMIYVNVPPREYEAAISVKLDSDKTENTCKFTTEDFYNEYYESLERGFYVKVDFSSEEYTVFNEIKPFAYNYDKFPSYASIRDGVKTVKEFQEKLEEYRTDLGLSNSKKPFNIPLYVLIGACIAILIAVIIIAKAKRK